MAWALKDPSGLGKYRLDGDIEGWAEQLEAYLHSGGMSKEHKAQVWDGHRILLSSSYGRFYKNKGPVVFDESPRNFKSEKLHKDLYSMLDLGVLAVDEVLKKLIDQFEPGVHQFFPLTITMPKNKVFPRQYYVLVIRQFIEGYIEVEGTFYPPTDARCGRYFCNGNDKAAYNRLQVSSDVVRNCHLWRDTRLVRPNVFISDALQEAIKDAGLTIFRHHKVREV